MELQKFQELTERLLYKGKPCISIKSYDWRNGFASIPEGYIYVSIFIHAIGVEDGKSATIEDGGLVAIKDIENTSEWSHITNIKNRLVSLETHEVEETFALDGVRVFNPHERVTELKSVFKEAA